MSRFACVDPWVLQDGQTIYDVLPKEFADSLRTATDAAPDRAIPMP